MKLEKRTKKELILIIEGLTNEVKESKEKIECLDYMHHNVVDIIFKTKKVWFEKQLIFNDLYSDKLMEGFDFAYKERIGNRIEMINFVNCYSVYEFMRNSINAMESWDYSGAEGDKGNFVNTDGDSNE